MPGRHVIHPKRKVGRPKKRFHNDNAPPPRPREPVRLSNPDLSLSTPDNQEDENNAHLEELRQAGVDLVALELSSDAYHADMADMERLQSHEDRKKYFVGKTDAEVKQTRKCIEVMNIGELPFYLDSLVSRLATTPHRKLTCSTLTETGSHLKANLPGQRGGTDVARSHHR